MLIPFTLKLWDQKPHAELLFLAPNDETFQTSQVSLCSHNGLHYNKIDPHLFSDPAGAGSSPSVVVSGAAGCSVSLRTPSDTLHTKITTFFSVNVLHTGEKHAKIN